MITQRARVLTLAAGIVLALGLLATERNSPEPSVSVRMAGTRSPGPTAQEEGDQVVQPSPVGSAIPRRLRTERPRGRAAPAKTQVARRPAVRPAPVPASPNFRTRQAPARVETPPAPSALPLQAPAQEAAPAVPSPAAEPALPEAAAPRIPVLTAPVLLTQPAAYPDEALHIVLDRALITPELRVVAAEGRVVLKVLVREDGSVAEVRIQVSSGNLALDRAAVDAAAGWQFRPATRDGAPIEAWAIIPVRFVIPP